MRRRIKKDHQRFKRIIKGRIREELQDLVSRGSLVGKQGKETIKVPVKEIDIPQFRYDPRSAGGVASGKEKIGRSVKPGPSGPEVKPGTSPGPHYREVEVQIEEIAEILQEELSLPRIEPKSGEASLEASESYRSRSTTGPETLLIKKRAFKRGLLRKALMEPQGESNKKDFEPVPAPPRSRLTIAPIKEDKEYLFPEEREKSEIKAVIFFMRDVSGSMGGEKTEIIRQENYLIDIWLKANYPKIDRVYLIHDVEAREVKEEDFYELSSGGGTKISSVYQKASDLIADEYPSRDWNIYQFHFSDGENFTKDTEKSCLPLLKDQILPKVNLFGYGQVSLQSPKASNHLKILRTELEERNFVGSIIPDKESILRSIQDFLGGQTGEADENQRTR